MNENTGQFRTATFGGFHRQDVLDYIEQLTRSYREEKEALTARIEEMEQAEQTERESRRQQDDEFDAIRRAKEAAEAELQKAQKLIEQKELALKESKEQLHIMELKIQEMEPSVRAWQLIRQTAGEIEVGAHERAQATIRDAKERADQIRQEGINWLLEAQERCEHLRSDLKSSILAAESQLDMIQEAFSKTEVDLDGIQDSISGLIAGLQPTEDA